MCTLSKTILASALFFFTISNAWAGDLIVSLTDQDGNPVPDAVISLHVLDENSPDVSPVEGLQISQANLQFMPDVLIVPLGSDVGFPNFDMTGHHVYSFSPAKNFDVRIIAQGGTARVNFDQAGLVVIGCNIHDSMVGYIHVMDTPWTGLTDESGSSLISDLAEGTYRVDIWHASQNAGDNRLSSEIHMGSGEERLDQALDLRRPRQRRRRYE